MKFFQSDSMIKRMADTIGLPWITFHRINRYSETSKLSVVGVPWYDEEEWKKVKKLCEDPETLHGTYQLWQGNADKATIALLRRGKPFERVKIIAKDYAKWCEKHKIRKNRKSRIRFVQYLLKQKLDI
jgi:hypothetical protein